MPKATALALTAFCAAPTINTSGKPLKRFGVTMVLPTPESLSQIQRTLWEFEGIVLNVLLFGKFVRHEVETLLRRRRRRTGGVK
jgi:hypothetical protein